MGSSSVDKQHEMTCRFERSSEPLGAGGQPASPAAHDDQRVGGERHRDRLLKASADVESGLDAFVFDVKTM